MTNFSRLTALWRYINFVLLLLLLLLLREMKKNVQLTTIQVVKRVQNYVHPTGPWSTFAKPFEPCKQT